MNASMEIIQVSYSAPFRLLLIHALFLFLSTKTQHFPPVNTLHTNSFVYGRRIMLKVKYINLQRADLGHVTFIYIIVCIIEAGRLQCEAKC